MINNLPDYTGAWLMADLMQRRGRDPEEESRKPAKEDRKMEELDRQEAAKPPAPDAETILRQAAYVTSAEVEAALDDSSDEHTSELTSPLRISYAVTCLENKNN